MAFSFQHVGQTALRTGEMPNPDALARCHASGKRSGAVTQEILFSPSGDCVGHVNTLTGEKTERWEAAGVIGEVIFHTGESHFRLGVKTLGSREQAEGLAAVCKFWHSVGMSHLCARTLS